MINAPYPEIEEMTAIKFVVLFQYCPSAMVKSGGGGYEQGVMHIRIWELLKEGEDGGIGERRGREETEKRRERGEGWHVRRGLMRGSEERRRKG